MESQRVPQLESLVQCLHLHRGVRDASFAGRAHALLLPMDLADVDGRVRQVPCLLEHVLRDHAASHAARGPSPANERQGQGISLSLPAVEEVL